MEEKIKEQVETKINEIVSEGIQLNNLEMLETLVEIQKNLAETEKLKSNEEVVDMRNYGNEYGNYGREQYGREQYGNYGRRRRDSRGRYMRRGVDSRYEGEEMLHEMYGNYQNYSEGREQYNRGNYGAKQETMQSLDYMLQSVVDFIEMLKEDASSQEEIELIQKYAKEISGM